MTREIRANLYAAGHYLHQSYISVKKHSLLAGSFLVSAVAVAYFLSKYGEDSKPLEGDFISPVLSFLSGDEIHPAEVSEKVSISYVNRSFGNFCFPIHFGIKIPAPAFERPEELLPSEKNDEDFICPAFPFLSFDEIRLSKVSVSHATAFEKSEEVSFSEKDESHWMTRIKEAASSVFSWKEIDTRTFWIPVILGLTGIGREMRGGRFLGEVVAYIRKEVPETGSLAGYVLSLFRPKKKGREISLFPKDGAKMIVGNGFDSGKDRVDTVAQGYQRELWREAIDYETVRRQRALSAELPEEEVRNPPSHVQEWFSDVFDSLEKLLPLLREDSPAEKDVRRVWEEMKKYEAPWDRIFLLKKFFALTSRYRIKSETIRLIAINEFIKKSWQGDLSHVLILLQRDAGSLSVFHTDLSDALLQTEEEERRNAMSLLLS